MEAVHHLCHQHYRTDAVLSTVLEGRKPETATQESRTG